MWCINPAQTNILSVNQIGVIHDAYLIIYSVHFSFVERDLYFFYKAVGKLVRKHRGTWGMSQQYLADAAGLNKVQIQRIENAKYPPNLDHLLAIAKVLGVQPVVFFDVDYQIEVTKPTLPGKKRKEHGTTTHFLNKNIEESEFLNSPKTTGQVVAEFKRRYNLVLTSSAASGMLTKAVKEGKLEASPGSKKGSFRYQKRKERKRR